MKSFPFKEIKYNKKDEEFITEQMSKLSYSDQLIDLYFIDHIYIFITLVSFVLVYLFHS